MSLGAGTNYPESVSESRRGLVFGTAAYVIWGAFPLYWPLLEPAGALEIMSHRVLWCVVAMVVLTVAGRRVPQLRAVLGDRRTMLLLALAASVITINWSMYIWGVNNGRVVETALGYFINPLVTVLMGVFVLAERLRPLQWAAMALAALAVVVLTIDYGRPPWVALVLAGTFGTYGLPKKQANVGAVESLTVETLLIAPFALSYLGWLVLHAESHFAAEGITQSGLFVFSGLLTAIPLLLFGAAATRVPMVTLGLLQYLAPVLQFALGVVVLREDMPPGRWIGFTLVWIALAVFTFEALRHRRRQLQLIAEASAG